VHSVTKYLGGHGTTMGGAVVESGKFPWDNGKFPHMMEPSKGYHGVRFYETFGDFGFTMKARMETMRTLGPTLSPMNAWQLLQGIETLPLRMERHVQNAVAVARYLEDDPRVAWVNYPALASSKYNGLCERYLPKGAGGILTFGVKAADNDADSAKRAGEKLIDACTFLSHLANIGDARTLIIHPASTTHRQLNEAEQHSAGVTPDLIRLSVGLESVDDLIWDLDQALSAATA
jgi:O-acetylhomoserine (thiol)-lyase